ncbi:MAG: hypothetical protein ABI742_13545, partial [Gemmatimonadota bacterium]
AAAAAHARPAPGGGAGGVGPSRRRLMGIHRRPRSVERGRRCFSGRDLRFLEQLENSFMLIARIAATAKREEPAIPVQLNIPKPRSGEQNYLTGGRVVLEQARNHQELLTKYGLTAGFLDQTATLLDQYETAIKTKNSGTSSHVGANAEMQELATEVQRGVKLLDAFNRPRFRKDPEKRAAWKSARDVVRHTPKPAEEPAKPEGDSANSAA